MTVEPEFTHDCEKCVFLGTIRRSEMILVTDEVTSALTAHIEGAATIADLNKALGVKPPVRYDLYVCRSGGTVSGVVSDVSDWADKALGPSILARYGHDGPEYKSSPHAYADKDPELALGLKLAQETGNIPMCGVTGDEDGD